jgi:peptide/nickel transport system permease protein
MPASIRGSGMISPLWIKFCAKWQQSYSQSNGSKSEAPACAKPLRRRQAKSEIRNNLKGPNFKCSKQKSLEILNFENSNLFRFSIFVFWICELRSLFGCGYAALGSMSFRRIFHNVNFTLGICITLAIILTGLLSLVYTPYPPNRMNLSVRFQAPNETNLLGTDQYGRDILSRVMKGSTNSIIVGLVAVSIGMSFGILLGSLAAFYRGWADEAIMRVSDVLYGFPAVLSAILITSILGPGIINSMIAIGIFNIPIFARVTRATSLSVWERDFVTSGKAIGRRNAGIIWGYILPNILSPLIVQGTVQFAIAILAEAGLSYLGLGTQPPHASWGRMLNEAQTFMGTSPWLAIFPGCAIALAVLGFNLLGDGLRDVLDPRLSRTS